MTATCIFALAYLHNVIVSYTCDLRINKFLFYQPVPSPQRYSRIIFISLQHGSEMEALEKQNFPFIYIAPFSQIATWQKFLLLQNATSEKSGFEHTLERKGLELQESS